MTRGFTRGGFDAAIPVYGGQTTLRPVEHDDVDLLVRRHADEDVARFWDSELFTREEMLERLARPDVAPYIVVADGKPVGEDHAAEWVLLEFSPR
jgi:RimJ/RimL family protein N-acetyltransferase